MSIAQIVSLHHSYYAGCRTPIRLTKKTFENVCFQHDCCAHSGNDHWPLCVTVVQESSLPPLLLCAVVRHFYHDFHPNVGIHLMKLGKIQLYVEQLSAAQNSLQQVSHLSVKNADRFSGMSQYKITLKISTTFSNQCQSFWWLCTL